MLYQLSYTRPMQPVIPGAPPYHQPAAYVVVAKLAKGLEPPTC
jgi:hypothetical protein